MYTVVKKVMVTLYANYEKTELQIMPQTFRTCGETINDARKNVNQKIKEYANNPYVVEVKPIYEHFEN